MPVQILKLQDTYFPNAKYSFANSSRLALEERSSISDGGTGYNPDTTVRMGKSEF